ncbi:beta strand repeat-containing protein, partial [Hymenobacter algoricola]|uniref:beta strand repeat-containing protein n=1 Tax=Hymenobacter algoricola TaxID=486267 RepID=UPI0031F011BB
MKTILQSAVLLLLTCGIIGRPVAQAQTPTLEFAAGASNPTGNGPSINDQVITFQANANNPTGSTFSAYSPTTTATLSLSDQQFAQPATKIVTGTGVAFGANLNAAGSLAQPLALFPLLNLVGGSTNADYISATGLTGGIDVAANRGIELFVSVETLPTPVPANARYRYADLTINFNRSVANPVIHLTGLGGNFGGGIGFTSELDLVSADLGATAVTLSKLKGSTELEVTPTQILNNAPIPGGTTGAGAASGSVLVNTPNGGGVRSLVFRIYLRPDANGGAIHTTDNSRHTADGWLISVSSLAAVSPITGVVYEDVNYGGGAGRPRTASGSSVRSGARVELYNVAGTFVSATTTNTSGQYTFTPGLGDYIVRVVNSTVTSSRPGYTTALSPVQTYNNDTDHVGGEDPTKADAAAGAAGTTLASLNAGTTIAQSQTSVTVAVGTTAVEADFGFNFSTIVNTNNSGQGSLRQFVANSNVLLNTNLDQAAFNGTVATGTIAIDPAAGMEYAIFMMNDGRTTGTALPGLRLGMTAPTGYNGTTKAFTFNVGTLFRITDSNTAIDGKVQTQLTGEGTLPTATALAGEIILDLTASGQGGLAITGGNTRIASLNISSAGVNTGSRALNTAGAVIEDGVAIVLSGAATSGSVVTDVTGQNNTIATVLLANGATGVTLNNNSFRVGRSVAAVGTATIAYDGAGVLLTNASNNTIRNNNISNNSGFGIELLAASNGNTISNNIINANGLNTTTTADDAGISIQVGNNNLIQANTITGNSGDGIMAMSGTSGNRFTQNNTGNNNGNG